jgi:hypothetical protein
MLTKRLALATSASLCVVLGCSPGTSEQPTARTAPADGVRFEVVAKGAATTGRQSTGGVSLVDYDGDGDADLFVTNG